MALLIKGDDARDMARQLQKLTGQQSMADAVRLALRNEIARQRGASSLSETIAQLQADVRAHHGPHKVDFDMKAYLDQDEDI